MRKSYLFVLALLLPGCAVDRAAQTAFAERGYSVSGKNPFRFEVDPQLLRQWGGAGSPRYNQVLEEELERRNICRNAYSLRNEHVRDGLYSVTGRCRS